MKEKDADYKIEIEIDNYNYDKYVEFSNDVIYNKVIEIYDNANKLKKKNIVLEVTFTSKLLKITNKISFNISDIEPLTEVLLPFFQDKEEYEKCDKILKICKKLKK